MSISVTCKCGTTFNVKNEFAGRECRCTDCGEMLLVPNKQDAMSVQMVEPEGDMPLAAEAEGVGASPPGDTKVCPFCGETIKIQAIKCRFCKEMIGVGMSEQEARPRCEAKETLINRMIADRSFPEIPAGVGRKFRLSTIIVWLITVGLIVTAVLTLEARDTEGIGVFCIVTSIIMGIIGLVLFGMDLPIPAKNSRKKPTKGFKAFMSSLRQNRKKYAYACLLPADKDDTPRYRPEFSDIKCEAGTYDFSTQEGFINYWRDLTRNSGGYTRTTTIRNIRSQMIDEDHAIVTCDFTISAYPSLIVLGFLAIAIFVVILILAFTKRERMTLTKLMRRVDGQWYVFNGELTSGEDLLLSDHGGEAYTS